MIHAQPHPFARKMVRIKSGALAGNDFYLEDWWDRLMAEEHRGEGAGEPVSWQHDSRIACTQYARRVIAENLPMDEEVVYGKIGALGYLIHVSQLEDAE